MSDRDATSPSHPPLRPVPLQCPICGYDVRHDLTGGCPECGGTLQARYDWVYVRGRRQVEWIFLGLGWLVVVSIGLPLLVAFILAIA